nr:TraM recognition domain-containing protein [Alteromonas antoniana]
MAKSLGDKLAGEASKNTEARPTTSPTAFLSDNDEVGYYLTEGTAVAAAQARSIGFALQYCAQDLSAMRRLSDQVAKEVDSIWGNTNLKMFGRVLDNATTDEIIKYVGEDYFARIDRYDINEAGMSRSLKAAGYSVSKENILDVKDLQNLVEGEVYFHYNGKLALVRIPMLSTQELEYVRLNDYFSLSNTSSGEPVSMDDYNRFMKHAARFIKDEEIEFTETNHSLPNSLQQSAHLVEKFAGDIRMGTSYIAGTQMKLDLDLLHYHHEDATSDFDEDFEHEFDDVSPGQDPQETTGPEQLSTEEYGFDTDEDGMPFANVAFEEKADSSKPGEDITGDDLAFTDSISVESESNSDESTGHVIAEEVASQTQNIFDTVFGVQGRDIVESSMAELSDVITGDSDGSQVAKDVVENVSRTVTHPNPPTLAKNPRKTKEQLRALINVYSSEIAEDDI